MRRYWHVKACGLAGKDASQSRAATASTAAFDFRSSPGLSGFELRARLRALGINTPVFLITAYDQAPTRNQTERTAAAGYFPKPFDDRSLIAVITRAIAALLLFSSAPLASAQEVSDRTANRSSQLQARCRPYANDQTTIFPTQNKTNTDL